MTSNRSTTPRGSSATEKGSEAAARREYRDLMIAEGFSREDATAIAEKTVFRDLAAANDELFDSRPKTKANREPQAKAIGDLIGGLPPAPAAKAPATPEPEKPKPAKPARKETPVKAVYDYRYEELPSRVRDLIEAHLAIEAQDARAAGTIGFMTRALAIATLPHRRTPEYRFVRRNGDFTLTMLTAHPEGLPFGTLPRLLLTWVCSEAVRTKEPVLSLGPTLASYLNELGLKSTGGKRGDITRLKHAMTTLFSAIISAHYNGRESWALQNVLLADKVEWWQPQDQNEAGEWQSRLVLSRPFFQECVDHPVPVNLVAMKALRRSPLALDIYVWLTHRMSYLSKRTIIPWFSLSAQFGADYAMNDQGLRDFRRAFLRELKHVVTIYTEARISHSEHGLILYPSPTHVPPKQAAEPQGILPF